MKEVKKKTEMFVVRVTESEKSELESLLDEAKTRLNKDNEKLGRYLMPNGEIILEALRIGLSKVRR